MTYRLLFADDSATMHRVLEITLAQEDVALILARGGHEALAHCRQVVPDVALIDVDMPDLDGYAVCEHIRADPRTAHTPVLLLESAEQPVDPARAASVGATGRVVKPFETQVLLAQLAKARGVSPGDEAMPVQNHPQTFTPAPPATLAPADERPSFFGGPQTAPRPAASSSGFGLTGDIALPSRGQDSAQAAAIPISHKDREQTFVPPVGDDITFVGPPRYGMPQKASSTRRIAELEVPLSPGAAADGDAKASENPSLSRSPPADTAAQGWLNRQDETPSIAADHPPGSPPANDAAPAAHDAHDPFDLQGLRLPELPIWDSQPHAPGVFRASDMLAAEPASGAEGSWQAPHAAEAMSESGLSPELKAHLAALVKAEVARQLSEVITHLAPAAAGELHHHPSPMGEQEESKR